SAVTDVVTADRETVAVATEKEDMQVGAGQTDSAGERNPAAMDEVRAVAVNEIGKARGTTDARESNDLFVLEISFLENFVERSEHGEIAAARAPGRMIGGDCLFG